MKKYIRWSRKVWNPVTGCSKFSPGCKSCYAEVMARRLKGMGMEKYSNGFDLTLHEDVIDKPLQWRKPQIVFVNSMSDLFHKDVPVSFIHRVFEVMHRNPHHIFCVLTKRAERMVELSPDLPWADNIWMSVSVESQDFLDRVDALRETGAAHKLLSLEPLLGALPDLCLDDIDWVVVGGESGPSPRPMEADWAREIRDKCIDEKVPFFFKQWGGRNRKRTGYELDGEIWLQYPEQMIKIIEDK